MRRLALAWATPIGVEKLPPDIAPVIRMSQDLTSPPILAVANASKDLIERLLRYISRLRRASEGLQLPKLPFLAAVQSNEIYPPPTPPRQDAAFVGRRIDAIP